MRFARRQAPPLRRLRSHRTSPRGSIILSQAAWAYPAPLPGAPIRFSISHSIGGEVSRALQGAGYHIVLCEKARGKIRTRLLSGSQTGACLFCFAPNLPLPLYEGRVITLT